MSKSWFSSGKSKPSAVGVHCYAGGFAVGVSKHFDVVAHFEELDAGLGVFQDNFPKAELTHSEPKDWPTKRYRDVAFVYGNPPCAPWSQSAGNMRKGLDDPRVKYTFDVAAAALALQPKVFVFESVSRILKNGKPVLDELTETFHKNGYAVTHFLTNAVLHGVAQYRERFHFVAHKVPFYEPARLDNYSEALTVRDAIGDLEKVKPNGKVDGHYPYEPEAGLRPLLDYMLQGEDGWRAHQRAVVDGLAERAYLSMLYKRLRYDCPSNTVVAVDRLIHPALPRMVTVREAARLCSYPDDFTFRESGNRWTHDPSQAVCPNVAECIAESAIEGIASGEKAEITVEEGSLMEPDSVIDYRVNGREFHKLFLRDFKATRSGRDATPFKGVG